MLEIHLNLLKAMHNESVANIRLNEEKLKLFSLICGTRQGYPFCHFLFSIEPGILTREIRPLIEIKEAQMGKEVKLSLFANDMVLFIKELNQLEQENSYSRGIYSVN